MELAKQHIVNPEFEKIEYGLFSSLSVHLYRQPYFTRSWHHHPELELLLITKGSGQRFVGDSVENFEPGDLILLGEHLPHAWISDEKYMQSNSNEYCESHYVQFNSRIFNNRFFEYPELKHVRALLKNSSRGIKIHGVEKEKITTLIKKLPKQTQVEKLLQLIRILDIIGTSNYEYLASKEFLEKQPYHKSKRMNDINNYIMENFRENVTVEQCAQRINMTVTSFCRFFKNHTNQTFTQYLNVIRIEFAQKLLLNTEMPIKEICYECGFNSVPYFNQRFKIAAGKSPGEYRNRK